MTDKIKVLFIYDDLWHPHDVIDRGFQSFTERLNSYDIDFVITAKDILTESFLDEFDVITVACGNAINASNSAPWFEYGVSEVTPEHIRRYVEKGGGLLSLHAGNAFKKGSSRSADEFISLTGCAFISHPPRCLIKVTPVGNSPLVAGIDSFCERDEHYIIELLCDGAEVFLKSESEAGGESISGYTRNVGSGRVAALTPGHILSVWQNRNYQNLIMNCWDFCANKA